MKKTYIIIIALIAIVAIAAIGFSAFHGDDTVVFKGDIKDNGQYSIKVTNSDNKPIQDMEFNMTEHFNKKVINNDTVKTDSNGMIKGELKNKESGTHSIKVSNTENNQKRMGAFKTKL